MERGPFLISTYLSALFDFLKLNFILKIYKVMVFLPKTHNPSLITRIKNQTNPN